MFTPHKLNSVGYSRENYRMAIRVDDLFLRKLAHKLLVSKFNEPCRLLKKKRAAHNINHKQMHNDFLFVANKLIPELQGRDFTSSLEGTGIWSTRRLYITINE